MLFSLFLSIFHDTIIIILCTYILDLFKVMRKNKKNYCFKCKKVFKKSKDSNLKQICHKCHHVTKCPTDGAVLVCLTCNVTFYSIKCLNRHCENNMCGPIKNFYLKESCLT